jgi:uncharacterized membrane protein YoaK (UPF0700 family)
MASTPSPDHTVARADERDGPLPALLLVLTFTTGVVDAVSYLGLGHVFVANMTGNVVFLGFAAAGAHDFSLPALFAALIGFLCGALAGGRLGAKAGAHRGRLLALALLLEFLLVGAALVYAIGIAGSQGPLLQSGLVVLLALAMGVQNATARRLGVADLTTTVLTLTLTGLAADASTTKEERPRAKRRLAATGAMFLGAAVGAFLQLQFGVVAALVLTLGLLVANSAGTYRAVRSTAAWTLGNRT